MPGIGIIRRGHGDGRHLLRRHFPAAAVIFMKASFHGDGFLCKFGKPQGGLRIRRALSGRRKHAREIAEKARILQNVVSELAFNERAVPQRHHKRMSQLRAAKSAARVCEDDSKMTSVLLPQESVVREALGSRCLCRMTKR